MTFKSSQFKTIQKGFTLVELLVVIAILGILAVGLIAAINPADKLRASSDSRVLSDVGVLARASEAYATANSGNYPASITDLVSASELKTAPIAPSGYAAYSITGSPSGCTAAGPTFCASIYITGELKSSKYNPPAPGVATPRALYSSSNGKQCQVTAATIVCPP